MLEKLIQGLRRKLRFISSQGTISIESLFDLPLESNTKANLYAIASELYAEMQKHTVLPFMKPKKEDEEVVLKFDIIKYIIELKQAEAEEKAKAAEAKRRVQLVAEVAEEVEKEKIREELKAKPLSELKAELGGKVT